jgi:hypothetical protein
MIEDFRLVPTVINTVRFKKLVAAATDRRPKAPSSSSNSGGSSSGSSSSGSGSGGLVDGKVKLSYREHVRVLLGVADAAFPREADRVKVTPASLSLPGLSLSWPLREADRVKVASERHQRVPDCLDTRPVDGPSLDPSPPTSPSASVLSAPGQPAAPDGQVGRRGAPAGDGPRGRRLRLRQRGRLRLPFLRVGLAGRGPLAPGHGDGLSGTCPSPLCCQWPPLASARPATRGWGL